MNLIEIEFSETLPYNRVYYNHATYCLENLHDNDLVWFGEIDLVLGTDNARYHGYYNVPFNGTVISDRWSDSIAAASPDF